MTKNSIYLITIITLFSCLGNKKNTKPVNSSNDNQNIMTSLEFIKPNVSTFSKNKIDIPDFIVSYLSTHDNKKFKIGNIEDSLEINFSDAVLQGANDFKYNKRLNLFFYNKNHYLICYTKGGIGTHDVIDYLITNNEKVISFDRKTTVQNISSVKELNIYLEKEKDSKD